MIGSSPRRPPPAPDLTERQWDSIEKQDVLEYNLESKTYRVSFDSTTESVCTAVISTVATVSQMRPMELPPLCSVIDPDALGTLVETTVLGPSNGDVQVSFSLNDCKVTVHTYGIITVQPPQAETTD